MNPSAAAVSPVEGLKPQPFTGQAVIVDPYSSGAMLAPEFLARGLRCIAVTSTKVPIAVYAKSFVPGDFEKVIAFEGSLDALVEELGRYSPRFVIPGTECGVELADQLAARLCPHLANEPGLAQARRHKGHMGDAVARRNLPHARQLYTNDLAQVEAWMEREGLEDAPLILKPPKSAGTDSVSRVRGRAQLRATFQELLGRRNKLEQVNDTLLVQEFLVGDEYVVDTFSHHGVHTVTNICRYSKIHTDRHVAVYDHMDFLEFRPSEQESLVMYTFNVLDALGIKFGPAHNEVMMTEDGPKLIESGARMHGAGHPRFARLCTGDSQLDRMVRFYSGQEGGVEINHRYRLNKSLRIVFLICRRSGVVRNAEILGRIRELPSFHDAAIGVRTGDRVTETSDLFTSLGFVALLHESGEVVLRDYLAVKELEQQLEIEPLPD
ncbi:ATP-grasp domain-containing protein [Pyxidicoccus sp. MSG2]|uniref:ATP-grasp domain-containing protein n=1 Tax=Pyxidicoccus sp. MSG2 TaxID=2996790 RepID=UPI00226F2100|nr:ATP-grasp domain-containing protein [Pyxidicoccus sp. MSG2]MCY1018664.1 ATP-grasp domain-containing protein [Pyxidicoccus sp. MSG2]